MSWVAAGDVPRPTKRPRVEELAEETGPLADGEVRFDDPSLAAAALANLQGVPLLGSPLTLILDETSKDRSKLIVKGIPAAAEWQELKDHFAAIGQVGFADVWRPGSKGKGKGKKGASSAGFMSPAGFGGSAWAELRFDDPNHAYRALTEMQGVPFMGCPLGIEADPSSMNGTKLKVTGVPPGAAWQDLKDHFKNVGQVGFVEIHNDGMMASAMSMAPAFGYYGGKGAFAAPAFGFGQETMWGGGKATGYGMPMMAAGRGMGMGCKGGKASFAGGTASAVGEVRFEGEDPATCALTAVQQFNGAQLDDRIINVVQDGSSKDGAKVLVTNLPPAYRWQELKDSFSVCGPVAFVSVKG